MMTFILSVIAGLATFYVAPALTKILQPYLDNFPIHEGEYQTITFVLLLLAVSIAAILSGFLASAFTVLLGGTLGLFGVRLFKVLRALFDYQNNDKEED